MKATTRDIGIAIRDFIEGNEISHFEVLDDDYSETLRSDRIEHVDVSDPNNPIVYMESGAVFHVRIIAKS